MAIVFGGTLKEHEHNWEGLSVLVGCRVFLVMRCKDRDCAIFLKTEFIKIGDTDPFLGTCFIDEGELPEELRFLLGKLAEKVNAIDAAQGDSVVM